MHFLVRITLKRVNLTIQNIRPDDPVAGHSTAFIEPLAIWYKKLRRDT
jgi:hypothetical protein